MKQQATPKNTKGSKSLPGPGVERLVPRAGQVFGISMADADLCSASTQVCRIHQICELERNEGGRGEGGEREGGWEELGRVGVTLAEAPSL